MSLYLVGSLAFDRIMTFPGHFEDHILPEKLHILNVCFLIERLEQKRGGTAGNTAYSLALLGEAPCIVSSVGKDFAEYEAVLTERGLPLDGIVRQPDLLTAGAYITTDLSSNQITGFYPAAMTRPASYRFDHVDPSADLAIISPTNIDDMRNLPRRFRELGMRYIFDPGQQIPLFSGEELLDAMTGAAILISNDYEMEMICQATGKTRAELLEHSECLITTLGADGSSIMTRSGETHIGIAQPVQISDPTGCGDAYRAGLLKGLHHGLDIAHAARLGAVCASFCVEHAGPQEHSFSMTEFAARYQATFGVDMPL